MSKTINEELHQPKFRNQHQKVQLNILFTAGWIHSKTQQIFKTYGLSHQQYNVLRILKGAFPAVLSLGQIKDRMLDRMSDTSRIVDRLHLAGLLIRSTDVKDRRVANIRISEKGLNLLNEMEKEEANLDHISSQLSVAESEMLNALLDKIRSE